MNNKPKIYAIVGASGCGKTTAAQIMEREMHIKSLVSYTTRAMRPGEENGREHWFVGIDQMPPREEMLAYAHFGGQHYWTSLSQLSDGDIVSYIIDEDPLLKMTEKFGDRIQVVKVLIKKDPSSILQLVDKQRVMRDQQRTTLPDSFYDVIINNNGTIDDLRIELGKKITAIKPQTACQVKI